MGRILRQAEEWVAGILLTAILLDVLLQITARQLGLVLPFTEELARYLMIWLGFIGIAAAAQRGSHLAVTFVHDLVPQPWRTYLDYVNQGVFILFAALLGYAGWKLTLLQITTERRWMTLTLPMWPVNIVVPLGMVLTILAILTNWKRKGGEAQ